VKIKFDRPYKPHHIKSIIQNMSINLDTTTTTTEESEVSADLDVPVAPKRTRNTKEVDNGERCMARVWGCGLGPQCKYAKGPGIDYCKYHKKLASVTEVPCQYTEDGKHMGLFWGRVDEEEPILSDGYVAVQWKTDSSKARVAAALKEGKTLHKFSGDFKKGKKPGSSGSPKAQKAPKSKTTKKSSDVPRAKNAYMFFLADKREEVKTSLQADYEDGKVPAPEVAKKVGAMWKAGSEDELAPYKAMAKSAKAERDTKIASSKPLLPSTPTTVEEYAAAEKVAPIDVMDDDEEATRRAVRAQDRAFDQSQRMRPMPKPPSKPSADGQKFGWSSFQNSPDPESLPTMLPMMDMAHYRRPFELM
jgi:hypothetical protein